MGRIGRSYSRYENERANGLDTAPDRLLANGGSSSATQLPWPMMVAALTGFAAMAALLALWWPVNG